MALKGPRLQGLGGDRPFKLLSEGDGVTAGYRRCTRHLATGPAELGHENCVNAVSRG